MKRSLLMLVVLLVLFVSCGAETLPEGVQKLQTKHLLNQSNRIEVLQFFWLGCSHCQDFHENWVDLKKEFGDRVAFKNIPAAFDRWMFDARVYLAMEEVGLTGDGVMASYYEVRQGPEESKLAKDVRAVARWAELRYGTLEEDYINMFDSSLIEGRLQEIQELLEKYPMITGVPTVLISIPDQKVSYLVKYAGADATGKIIRDLVKKILSK